MACQSQQKPAQEPWDKPFWESQRHPWPQPCECHSLASSYGNLPQIDAHKKTVQHVQPPDEITYNTPPSPARLRFWCKFGVGANSATAFRFSLLGHMPSLETWCAKQLISSLKNSHLVDFSFRLCSWKWSNTTCINISSAPPLSLRRLSHHPNRLSSVVRFSSPRPVQHQPLKSGRIIAQALMACVHTHKIPNFPQWKQYIASMLHPWQFAKNPLSDRDRRNIRAPTKLSMASCIWGKWIGVFLGSDIELMKSQCKSADLCLSCAPTQLHYTMGFI